MPPFATVMAWYSSFFDNHPLHGGNQKHPDAYTSKGKYRRVYCANCYKEQFNNIVQSELQAHAEGRLAVLRTNDEIRDYLWSRASPSLQSGSDGRHEGYLTGRPEQMLGHLQRCPLQPQNISDRAREDYQKHRAGTSKSSQSVDTGNMPSTSIPSFIAQLSLPIRRQPSTDTNLQPSSPSGSAIAFNERPSTGPTPFDSASAVSSRVQSQLSRRSSQISEDQDIRALQRLWSADDQHMFEVHLIRMIAEGNMPLHFVENRSWQLFCQRFTPYAAIPSRKALTRRILPQELGRWRALAQTRLSGQRVTLQSDGWTGANNRHYIAFLASTPTQVFTIRVYDVSSERKTAENLLRCAEEVIKLLSQIGCIVVAWTTDASGESRKARRLLAEKDVRICVPDCYAHQINLVVGDYFKAKDVGLLLCQDQATELITWLRGKTFVLALLRDIRVASGLKPLTIIRAVISRWTAHYLAYHRLLDVRQALCILVTNPSTVGQINSGDIRSRQKSESMISIISDAQFWSNLELMARHLEPLAIAANVLQSSHCRLDQVLTTFGLLYHEFSKLSGDHERVVKEALLQSISQRWEKADQPIFIAAVILNPLLKLDLFAKIPEFTISGIFGILSHLWIRFYSQQVPSDLLSQLQDYFANKGIFASFPAFIDALQESAQQKGVELSIFELWKGVSMPTGPDPSLVAIALHIFAICPNSAACEHLFSSFGNILTKLRSRLSNKTLVELAELKLHLREEEFQSGSVKDRVKRHFDMLHKVQANSAANMNSNATTENIEAAEASETDNEEAAEIAGETARVSEVIQPFSHFISSFSAPLDNADSETLSIVGERSALIPLNRLFDFSNSNWAKVLTSSRRKLDEELEVSEMAAASVESLGLETTETLDDICIL